MEEAQIQEILAALQTAHEEQVVRAVHYARVKVCARVHLDRAASTFVNQATLSSLLSTPLPSLLADRLSARSLSTSTLRHVCACLVALVMDGNLATHPKEGKNLAGKAKVVELGVLQLAVKGLRECARRRNMKVSGFAPRPLTLSSSSSKSVSLSSTSSPCASPRASPLPLLASDPCSSPRSNVSEEQSPVSFTEQLEEEYSSFSVFSAWCTANPALFSSHLEAEMSLGEALAWLCSWLTRWSTPQDPRDKIAVDLGAVAPMLQLVASYSAQVSCARACAYALGNLWFGGGRARREGLRPGAVAALQDALYSGKVPRRSTGKATHYNTSPFPSLPRVLSPPSMDKI